jgi:hypothetical protein
MFVLQQNDIGTKEIKLRSINKRFSSSGKVMEIYDNDGRQYRIKKVFRNKKNTRLLLIVEKK